ncbi:MAG: class I SAM-dependent methyltransferase, partial [Bacteroidota bacterium]
DSLETKKVEEFFHGYAADFDSIYGHTKGRSFFDKTMDNLFRKSMRERFQHTLTNSEKPEIKTVLDIGCGGGVYCEAFLNQGKKVVGLDIAEGMLDLAKAKTKKYGDQISFVHAGYLDHEFNQKFDASVLMGFYDYIKEPIPVFEKLKRDTAKEIYMSFPQAGGFLAWQRKVRYERRNCPLYYYDRAKLEKLFAQVGWTGKAQIVDLKRDFFVKITL